jgi:hypothetical protein
MKRWLINNDWKVCGSWKTWATLHLPGGVKEDQEQAQYSRDFNPTPPGHETGLRPSRPRVLVPAS